MPAGPVAVRADRRFPLTGGRRVPARADLRFPLTGGRRVPARADRRGLAVVVAVTVAAGLIPVAANHVFYYWDDSAGTLLPAWYRIGTELRHGRWPALVPDLWAGGNFAAEAVFGLWNPVTMANAVFVSLLPDLALAATILKLEYLALLGAGMYLLAREYGARPAAAAVVGTALPFAGEILYWEAADWTNGLIGLVWTVHLWWSARRFARGLLNPVVPACFGILAMTAGNPYGVLGCALALAAIAAERLVARHWRPVGGLAVLGAAIAATGAVAFAPLVATAPVSARTSAGVHNDLALVPHLSDLVTMSAPSFLPAISHWGTWESTTPIAYLAWFAVPLLPWLRWRPPVGRWRDRTGPILFGGVYLLLCVAPSTVWLFRWPVRVLGYAWLAAGVLLAVLLSAGAHRVAVRTRCAAGAGLVLLGGYLSWAVRPDRLAAHLTATLLVLVLYAVAVAAHLRASRLLPAVLGGGTVLVLIAQVGWFPSNGSVNPWHFPHRVADIRAPFAHRYPGNTLQIASDASALAAGGRHGGVWRDLLLADQPAVAGFASVNGYSGIALMRFAVPTCMAYNGGVCPELYPALWTVPPGGGATLADLMRLETVVVQNGYLAGGTGVERAPPGWVVAERTGYVTVLRRHAGLPWPGGQVAVTAPGLRVLADRSGHGAAEDIRYSGSGRVVLARLAWPGWRASVDGRPVPVRTGPVGLIELRLPPAAPGGSTVRLRFTPPYQRLSVTLLAAGVATALGYGLCWRLRRRTPARPESGMP